MNTGGFNNKLQTTAFEVKKGTTQIINKTYQFNGDGTVNKETDGMDARFDRSYSYDFTSRMTKALTGAEARGGTDSAVNIPYHETYTHDAFGHRTGTNVQNFNQSSVNISLSYTNNRVNRANSGNYDADGNELTNPASAKTFEYDAACLINHTDIYLYGSDQQETLTYDGDGQVVKVVTSDQENGGTPVTNTTYQIRSGVLGGQIVYDTAFAYIYAGGDRIAMQNGSSVTWNHKDPAMKSLRSTGADGAVLGIGISGLDWDRIETDPDGKSVGLSNPIYYPAEGNSLFAPARAYDESYNSQYNTYRVDGISVPRDYLFGVRLNTRSGSLGLDLAFFSAEASRRVIGYRYGYTTTDGRTHSEDFSANTSSRYLDGLIAEGGTISPIYASSWAINLSLIPQDQQQRDSYAGLPAIRLGVPVTKLIRKNLEKNLNQKCKDFIKKLIETAAARSGSAIKSTNVLDLFDAVASNTGGPDSEGNYGGIWGYAINNGGSSAGGNWENGVASIGLAMSRYTQDGLIAGQFENLSENAKLFRTINSFHRFVTSQADAFTTIHELIHLSLVGPGDDDTELAKAALSFTGDELLDNVADTTASGIWGNRLTDACGGESARAYDQTSLNKYIRPIGGR